MEYFGYLETLDSEKSYFISADEVMYNLVNFEKEIGFMNIYCNEDNLIWIDWFPSGNKQSDNTNFSCPIGM